MPEYIERESLIKSLRKSHSYHAKTSRDYSLLCRDIRLVKEQPTVDAVEVVRCKDCVYWDGMGYEGRCEAPKNGLIREYTNYDDFCSYGERKEDVNA